MSELPELYEVPVVIDLKEAGLTHAKGKADECDGQHQVAAEHASVDLRAAGLVPAEELWDQDKVLQMLHEQAHPEGAQFWESCRERGCAEAAELREW